MVINSQIKFVIFNEKLMFFRSRRIGRTSFAITKQCIAYKLLWKLLLFKPFLKALTTNLVSESDTYIKVWLVNVNKKIENIKFLHVNILILSPSKNIKKIWILARNFYLPSFKSPCLSFQKALQDVNVSIWKFFKRYIKSGFFKKNVDDLEKCTCASLAIFEKRDKDFWKRDIRNFELYCLLSKTRLKQQFSP